VLEMVKTFEEWFEFINDGDVANLVDLVKTFNSVLNKLSKVHSRLDGVGDTLDDNGIISSFVKELPCSLKISSNTNSSSNSDLVSWECILWFINSSICF
jgi:hypothetical protein